ncbi:predicted protein, partial [Nematostella vectensis]
SLADGQWHQVCVKWNSTDGNWAFYVDGAKRGHGSKLKAGHVFHGQGKLVLGQRQDAYGGRFDVTQVFIGTLSNFDMWDVALPDDIIQSMGYGCGTWSGNTISWRNLRSSSYGNVGIQEYSECYIPG